MRAENGKRIKVQFVGRLENGTVFSETAAGKPLEFTLGKEEVIPGFVEAIQGMEPGQSKTVHLPPEKGFGTYDPDRRLSFQRGQLGESELLLPGMKLSVKDISGREFVGRVETVTDESVTLDMNHPLAGQRLEFEIRLQEVA